MSANRIKILVVCHDPFTSTLLKICLPEERFLLEDLSPGSPPPLGKKFDLLLLDLPEPKQNGSVSWQALRNAMPETPLLILHALAGPGKNRLEQEIAPEKQLCLLNRGIMPEVLEKVILQMLAGVPRQLIGENLPERLFSSSAASSRAAQPWCRLDPVMLLSVFSQPAGKTGGDTCEMIQLGVGRWLFFMGDLAGHGERAAQAMQQVREWLFEIARGGESGCEPHRLFNTLNDFFFRFFGEAQSMTCIAAVIDFLHCRIRCQSAGHPPLIGYTPSLGQFIRAGERDATDKSNEAGFRMDREKDGIRNFESATRSGDGRKSANPGLSRDAGRQVETFGSRAGREIADDIPIGWQKDHHYCEEATANLQFPPDTVFFGFTDGLLDRMDHKELSPAGWIPPALLKTVRNAPGAAAFPFRLHQVLDQLGYRNCRDDITIASFCKNELFPSELHFVIRPGDGDVACAVEDFVGLRTQDDELGFRTGLLVHEFVVNILLHGLKREEDHCCCTIYLHIRIEKKYLRIEVLDRGCEWDRSLLQQKDFDFFLRRNGRLASSGRGIALIARLADRITSVRYAGLNDTVFHLSRKTK